MSRRGTALRRSLRSCPFSSPGVDKEEELSLTITPKGRHTLRVVSLKTCPSGPRQGSLSRGRSFGVSQSISLSTETRPFSAVADGGEHVDILPGREARVTAPPRRLFPGAPPFGVPAATEVVRIVPVAVGLAGVLVLASLPSTVIVPRRT